jgi:hypothetical protein
MTNKDLGRIDTVTAASLRAEDEDVALQHRLVLRGLVNLARLTDPGNRRRYAPTIAAMCASAQRVLALADATADQRADAARLHDALTA